MTAPTIFIDREAPDPAAIAEVARRLNAGEVVAVPTETVYGIAVPLSHGADALHQAKGRDPTRGVARAYSTAEAAMGAVALPATAERLARRFWPGPMTLVVNDGTGARVGLRVAAHAVTAAIIEAVGEPLLLTSANRSGSAAACDAAGVRAELGDEIAVVDAGPATIGQASTVVAFHEDGRIEIVREGLIDRSMALRTAARDILLVCTGNTCRSPMAEQLFRKHWAKRMGTTADELLDFGGWVHSAGAATCDGLHATNEAVQVLRAQGMDLAAHRSSALTADGIARADAIYGMTPSHLARILEVDPTAAAKTSLLDPDEQPIQDPIGGGLRVYQECAAELSRAIERRLDMWPEFSART